MTKVWSCAAAILAFTLLGAACGADAGDGAESVAEEELAIGRGNVVTLDARGVLHVNAKAVFPIGVTLPPPVTSFAPSGKNGLRELGDAGVNFARSVQIDNAGWTDGIAYFVRSRSFARMRGHGGTATTSTRDAAKNCTAPCQ